MNTRREFLKSTGAGMAGAVLPLKATADGFKGELCFFSKHLPRLNWTRMAESVKQLGFAGVDLTVRPGGHVLPERAAEDLPRAVAAIRAAGLTVPMITTNLTTAGDPTAKPILSTAGRLSIPYYKPGYYRYALVDVRKELGQAMANYRGLIELSKEHGVQAGFHNHESYIGAPLWDVTSTIDQLDSKWAGYYFDVRHAVCEGGAGGWKIAFNLIAPRLKMIAVKDFYWEKTSQGWEQKDCPLGEGMVDWKAYFKLLKAAGFQGPISMHLEYEIKSATPAAMEENTLAMAQKDLAFLKARIQEAYT